MNKITLCSVALLAAYSVSGTAYAQGYQAMPDNMQMQNQMPMQMPPMERPDFKLPQMPKRPDFSEFPTPEELAKMTPPEPMTAEKIKKQFARQKARIEQVIAKDRKRAEKYAKDFARFQKHQADQLAKIMARAEKEREALLARINKREQRVLENFKNRNAKPNPEVKQY